MYGRDCRTRDLLYGGVSKANGAKAFAYWNSTDMVTCQGFEGTVSFEVSGVCGDIKLIDPMDGSVYTIGDDILKQVGPGLYLFENMPVKDYPLVITFGDF